MPKFPPTQAKSDVPRGRPLKGQTSAPRAPAAVTNVPAQTRNVSLSPGGNPQVGNRSSENLSPNRTARKTPIWFRHPPGTTLTHRSLNGAVRQAPSSSFTEDRRSPWKQGRRFPTPGNGPRRRNVANLSWCPVLSARGVFDFQKGPGGLKDMTLLEGGVCNG